MDKIGWLVGLFDARARARARARALSHFSVSFGSVRFVSIHSLWHDYCVGLMGVLLARIIFRLMTNYGLTYIYTDILCVCFLFICINYVSIDGRLKLCQNFTSNDWWNAQLCSNHISGLWRVKMRRKFYRFEIYEHTFH